MCRFRVAALCAALILSVTMPLHAADPVPADDGPTLPWYKRIFSGSKPKPKNDKSEMKEKPLTQKELSVSLQEEQKTYLERLQFCTRLRQIGTETNDNDLLRKADALEKMAEEVYQKKTNKLPDLLQEARAAEAALEEKRNAPTAGTASTNRVSGRAANGRPIVTRE